MTTAPTSPAVATRRGFSTLRVSGVTPVADDGSAIEVRLDVPEEQRDRFAFSPGQFVTLRTRLAGAEVRRSYSLCSTPQELRRDGTIRVGVRVLEDGVFSSWAARTLAPGSPLDVSAPAGRFTTGLDAGRRRRYAALVTGSGITPVLSLVSAALAVEPASTFTVLYGNRSARSAMFPENLADLKDRYGARLRLLHLFSRETQQIGLAGRRLDAGTLPTLLDRLLPPALVDEWFLCGSLPMVLGAKKVLARAGVDEAAVRTELFHDDDATAGTARSRADATGSASGDVELALRLDGRESTVRMGRGQTLLQAALTVRPELPYSCRTGVCATCRARVVRGEARMTRNLTLSPEDVADGYVLTCQALPASDQVSVDYDVV
jgi:ring-1,2-phenylacetyl-CoA epoxidase subunit PaaE